MSSAQLVPIHITRLRDFDFGEMEAEAEVPERPDLLIGGFIDPHGVINEARNGRRFLFLGYKGSGKSGIAEHLSLIDDPELFVRVVHIADLSFTSLGQMAGVSGELESRFPTAWSWLLLLQLFDSFSRDAGCNLGQDDRLWYVVEALKTAGFLPDAELTKTVETTLKKTAGLKLWQCLDIGRERIDKTDTDLHCFVDWLKRNASNVRSKSRHLLVVDGLDDLLKGGKLAHTALECLLFEVKRLNLEFAKSCNPAKILVLCRTDLFDRLPGANNNKLRQVYATNLDWSDNSKDVKQCPLIEIINRRASLTGQCPIDVFETFLPPTIDAYSKGDIRTQLLEHTRHIPRDIIMLFKSLQAYSGSGRLTKHQVFDGLAAYSRYLVDEMTDELGGYIDPAQIGMAKSLFTKVRKRATTIGELEDRAKRLRFPDSFYIRGILRVLFECSLIGNAPTVNSHSKDSHFKFRNRYATFDPFQAVLFHRGLWKGLDLH
ncbi:MAG TPA: hypothetical protein VGK64_06165 [Bryobacteraceae bacterium]